MNWLQALALGGATLGAKTVAVYAYMTSEVYKQNAPIDYEPPQTSIVVCTFNEEAWLEACLQSIFNQTIYEAYPERFELIIVDNGSSDSSIQIAKRYTSIVLESEPGKLNARHLGILDAKGEAIVAVDADCVLPLNWLNVLLRKFQENGVVAVSGSALTPNKLLNVGYIWTCLLDKLSGWRIRGCGSVFCRKAYLRFPFNLSVNQFDRSEIFQEEEVRFASNLKTLGKVVYELKAPITISPRYWICPTNLTEITCHTPLCKYCLEIATGQRF